MNPKELAMNYPQFCRLIGALIIVSTLVTVSFGQKSVSTVKSAPEQIAPSAAVTPVVFGPGQSGNPNCADLNALHVNGSGDIRFSHIITNFELKLDFGTPNGTFPFTTGNGRIVVGPEYPNRAVTVFSSGSTVSSWSSMLPITAVILKVGNVAYVYPYKPFRFNDKDLITGDQQSISHLTFCFGEPTGVTAGEISIDGRVVDSNGMGISKAQMILVNGATGESKITMTNPFGYYSFQDLDVNEVYVVNVSHKSFTFPERQRIISPADSVTGFDFVASPRE